MISKILQILALHPRISKVFLDHLEQFFLTLGQNNFGNKITLISCVETKLACEHCKLFSPQPWEICYEIYIQYLSFVIINLNLVRLLKTTEAPCLKLIMIEGK